VVESSGRLVGLRLDSHREEQIYSGEPVGIDSTTVMKLAEHKQNRVQRFPIISSTSFTRTFETSSNVLFAAMTISATVKGKICWAAFSNISWAELERRTAFLGGFAGEESDFGDDNFAAFSPFEGGILSRRREWRRADIVVVGNG
jgi:hypothetical protein